MTKALVLYYTCSNNTLKIAEGTEEILQNLDWEVKLMNLRSYSQENISFKPDFLILGVPVHYWEIPDAALRMIRKLPQFQGVAGFVFSTFGRCVCNSVPYYLARELQSKGVSILGGAQIAMPHSAFIDANTRIGDVETAFGKGEPTRENWEKYQSTIQDIAKRIEDGNINEINVDRLKKLHTRNVIGSMMNAFSKVDTRRNVMPHVQYDKEKCIQCHNCISTCDSQAITLSDDNEIVIDKVICRKCYKCIEECSEKALDTDWVKIIFWCRLVHRLAKNNNTMVVTG